uniref:tRNA (Cytosine(34)-C(5))-methyltransferase-like n=1 Tax=Dermatophagoides pteronyssinus TaxID=6956 RepID=A0A6P6Y557_DERPT|nr:tRNA (cytosine(34)-C(5))-methyltransferase-like [Dermatophagoides pteronyssinus]
MRAAADCAAFYAALQRPLPVAFRVVGADAKSEHIRRSSETGLLIRQEVVSMLPVQLLSTVLPAGPLTLLDLCAAPGSKTSQLLELLSARPTADREESLVVANDLSPSRVYMLLHRLRYLIQPCLLATREDSSAFPFLKQADGTEVQFSGVIADVPCSGDGTYRKTARLGNTWRVLKAMKLHSTQLKIAKRAAALAKVGGHVLYSTCSLNPVENEAVIDALVHLAEGALEVVKTQVEGFAHRSGLVRWPVMLEGKPYFDSKSVPPETQKLHNVPSTVFATGNPALANCLRFYPHDNDSGGFFCCLLRKKSAVPWEEAVRAASANRMTEA